ncbi:MAG: hypothetical protein HY369_04680 [Candidatus Aenigmarchaeota archaeon]|nr:hypothetical protein [Candidatus Aenigmarchaeota archaeon]
MQHYAYQTRNRNVIKVFGRGLRISPKSSIIVCRAVTGLSLPRAQQLVDGMVAGTHDLKGKFYTNIAKEMSSLLKSANANAESKGLDPGRLMVHASTHQSFAFQTPRRFKQRGRQKKIAHVQLVLEQR